MTRSETKVHRERHDPHWVEWMTGVTSGVLVIALMLWVTYEAVTRSGEPPALSIELHQVSRDGDLFRASFEIRNAAPSTAAAVTVAGEILEDGRVIERAEVTFDYVPAESRAKGALIFENDPAGGELTIRPTGFTDP